MRRFPTVLISDDEPLLVSAFAREMRRHRVEVIADSTSGKLHKLAKATQPDLIVLDVHQKMDGRVLLARLKWDPRTRNIGVLVLSSVDDPLTRHMCLNLGAIDYDAKPMNDGFICKVLSLLAESIAEPAARLIA